MGKKLVLAEKPSVARDLAEILGATQKNKNYFEGKEYVVTWALGHLLSLKMPEDMKTEWKTWELETLPMIPNKWENKPLPKTTGQLKTIAALGKRKDITGGIIATDSGREGELVAREIFSWIRFNKPLERLWISSQTKKAVLQGFKDLKPAKNYEALYYSALARSKADWLVGLNVSRALTVKYGDSLSAGRVQTPTLAAVSQREEKINKFTPITYYQIFLKNQGQKALLQLKNPQSMTDIKKAQEIVENLGSRGEVTEVTVKEKREKAPLPYDLTELQKEANAFFQFSAKKTLGIVQRLYENYKIVSYPRTDSKYLPQDLKGTMKERLQAIARSFPEANEFIKQGAKVTQQSVFNDSKVTDHYALIPTEEMPQLHRLEQDELKIYRLIVERFLGLFAKDYVEKRTKATVKFKEETFIFSTSEVLEPGFKTVENKMSTATFSKGQSVKSDFSIEKALTQAPKLLSEGQLLAYMDKNNLGTPATRAEIIEKLIKSELMERTGSNALKMTPKGKQLLKLVNPSLVTPELTSKWEKELEKIGKNQLKESVFVKNIQEDTKKLVSEIKNSQVDYKDFSVTTKVCPECGSLLREKNTRDGKIYVCTNQECSYRRRKDPKVSNHRCPVCHKKMEILDGKNGQYFRCKYDGTTEKIPDKKARQGKMNKHEEKRLMKKINQEQEPLESPLALALKAAMKED